MGQIVGFGNGDAVLSPSRKVRQEVGARQLAELCGLTTDAIRKWDRVQSKGGTGGLVPAVFQARILAYAAQRGLQISAIDLIAEPLP